jgi:cobalamin biosynthesis Mg chelatase CobN
VLCALSAPGVALAGNSPTRDQYIESLPKLHPSKHTSSSAKSKDTTKTKSTTSTTPSEASTPPVDKDTTTTVARHHRTKRRKTTHHKAKKPGKPKVRPKSTANRRAHDVSFKTHTATVTGSGGGISVWLLVILGLVLVGGSAAGIFRYRHSR